MRAPGCRWRTMPSRARPCRVTSATSCSDQPSRAAARLKADGLGRQISLGGRNRAQQQVADAVVEGIAARQHARPAGRDASRSPARRRRSDWARQACGHGSALRPSRGGVRRRPRARPTRTAGGPQETARRCRPRRCRRSTASARPCSLRRQTCAFSYSAAPRKPRRWPSFSRAIRASRRPCPSPDARPRLNRSRSRRASAASAAPTALRTTCKEQAIEAVIDATHPYAAQMSANAVVACSAPGSRWPRSSVPPGRPRPATNGRRLPTAVAAALAIGKEPRRVFLAWAAWNCTPSPLSLSTTTSSALIDQPVAHGPTISSCCNSAGRSMSTPSCAS